MMIFARVIACALLLAQLGSPAIAQNYQVPGPNGASLLSTPVQVIVPNRAALPCVWGDTGCPGLPVSGTVTATNPSVGATGAAAPSSGILIGGINAGNLVGITVDSSGRQTVNVNGAVAVTAASLPLPTNPSTVFSIQQTATASAVALPSQAMSNGAVCTALSTNTGTLYIGGAGVTSANGYPLTAGGSISYGVITLSAVYILDSVTTDKIACTGN